MQFWADLNSSYWFVPSLMCLAGSLLAIILTQVDENVGYSFRDDLHWLYSSQPSGARALLSMIAGSMITVAGVTFSMTLLSVSHASSQIGPRILAGFMTDRGNQITLGTFIATFSYCLLVLRTIQGEVSGSADQAKVAAFVPHISIAVGIVLAFASIGVLIFFINHVPKTISMTLAVARIGDELVSNIKRIYPSKIGEGVKSASTSASDFSFDEESAVAISANGKGYVTVLRSDRLMELAEEHDLVLKVLKQPGDFFLQQTAIVKVQAGRPLSDELESKIRDTFVWSNQRTLNQDARFAAELLVEVAVRALSPGVNDPTTATECISQLTYGLFELATREYVSSYRADSDGKIRIISETVQFAELFDHVFNRLRKHVKTDTQTTIHTLKSMQYLHENLKDKKHRDPILVQSKKLIAAFEAENNDEADLEDVTASYTLSHK